VTDSPRRWTVLSGFAFVGLFIAGLILLGDALGSVGDSDEQFVSYFGSNANHARDIVGAYTLTVAGLAFVVFLAHVCAALREHSGRELPLVAFGAALACAALLMAAAAALSAIATSHAVAGLFDEPPHEFSADTSRLATQFGYMLLVFAMWAAAACIAAISLATRAAGLFPTWLVVFGYVAAFALLFSFFFIPAVALPLWVLATSIALARGSSLTTSR
jgi:hypothetical protein